MTDLSPDLLNTLTAHRQEHVLSGWERLTTAERTAFAAQLQAIDFDQLAVLYSQKDEKAAALPPRDRIKPLPVETSDLRSVALGQAALRRGEVAVLVVAGGQGTRLGATVPKGLLAVGPVSGATLFQIHAEKVLAIDKRYAKPIPLMVMTSPATHADTEAYFRSERNFGLHGQQVGLFQQGTMPALDLATGKLLLEAPGKLFLSPNGHGGSLTALADCGFLARLKNTGIKHVFYFQVDNPLVAVCDPAFVGRHIATRSEVSSKVVFKERPEEKVGVLAEIDGRCGIIEYSDMPKAITEERAVDGWLAFRAGNPAIHLFSVEFLERVTSGRQRLAFHLARKKVPHFDPATGEMITPTTENALKFELFVFDALPLAERWLAVEAKREDEFSPLKNAAGPDSLETVQAAMAAQARRWLTAAGATVPEDVPVEISPTFALDAAEVQAKLPPGTVVNEPTYFTES
jgi:UDP-N-acetylglucosamine/UDP-N-acetylgalactosamine diphosphorylase